MTRSRSTAFAAVAVALLCNYWVLEDLLARRTDPVDAWISELGARSEVFGWRFDVLETLAGLAVLALALLLLGRLGPLSRRVRLGLLALAAAGGLIAIGGAAPLSCAEDLDSACTLSYDLPDVIHAGANIVAIGATGVAFALVGSGLLRLDRWRRAGWATLAIGSLWLLLAALTGLSYLVESIGSVNGLIQRCEQVLFGAWLVLLGAWASRVTGASPPPGGE